MREPTSTPDALNDTIRQIEVEERALAAQRLAEISGQLAVLAREAKELVGPFEQPQVLDQLTPS